MAFVPIGGSALPALRPDLSRTASSFAGDRLSSARCGPALSPIYVATQRRSLMPPVTMQLVDEMKRLNIRTHEVFMPALSSTMTEGRIVQWLKQPGEFVKQGECIMVVESDKADMDVESFDEGYLAAVLVPEGESCGVGQTVGLLAEKKEDIEKVQECGLDCVISGSGSRHDGTTAVTVPSQEPFASSVEEPAPGTPPARAAAPAKAPLEPPDCGEIFMPALSSTMTEGKVVEWLKQEGDSVKEGEIVMVVESDKADMDVESFDKGYLAHISVGPGEQCKVGEAVGYLAHREDQIAEIKAWALANEGGSTPEGNGVPTAPVPIESETILTRTETVATEPVAPPIVVNTGRIVASPYAKKLAKEMGVDLRTVRGSGDDGCIVAKDVLRAEAQGQTAGSPEAPASYKSTKIIATPDAKKIAKKERIDLAFLTGTGNFGRITAEDVLRAAGKLEAPTSKAAPPLERAAKTERIDAPQQASAPMEASTSKPAAMNAMQKAIVKNMSASLSVPIFRVAYKIKTDAFDELYAKLKPKGVTVSAMLAKAVGLALKQHPILNAQYVGDAIMYRPQINVGMAVALPDGGLITPVLKDADSVDIYTLSKTWKDLIKRASQKKLAPDEYNSGTFFISNLGMFGVDSFDAVLPPDAPSILAVAASKPVVGMQGNGMIGVSKEMNVNITCDHRHIYGAMAAEFLRDLAKLIEEDCMSLLL